jgi:hypothetical protein
MVIFIIEGNAWTIIRGHSVGTVAGDIQMFCHTLKDVKRGLGLEMTRSEVELGAYKLLT